jgi:proline iminopeptidase
LGDLGERRNYLYVNGPEKDFFEKLVAASPLAPELWQRAGLHQQKLVEEGRIFESALADLAQCQPPALLLRGKYDWVISQDQVSAFLKTKPDASLQTFEHSSHFIRFEEPDAYAEAIFAFVLNNRA